MVKIVTTITDEDYIAFIGKNYFKYIPRFKKFSISGLDIFRPTWHWPAFFFGPFWMFYRKLYLWGLFALILLIIPYINFIAWIAWGFTGYYIYYKHANKKITDIKRVLSSSSNLPQAVSDIGGVHIWLLIVGYVLIAISLLSILIAILIPQFASY